MLYQNTTGEDMTGSSDIVLREMLSMIVDDHMPPTLALAGEVEAQVLAVEDDLHNGVPWKYVLGAKVPAQLFNLFPLHCKPLDLGDVARAGKQAPQRRAARASRIVTPAPASPPQRPQISKQRASSVKPVVWSVADTMWKEVGSPKDKATVLELRKKIMSELEEKHNVKRTTSSNELGKWMKDRLD